MNKRLPKDRAPTRKDIEAGRYDAGELLGTYQRLCLGHASDQRQRETGASGGVLRTILANLLATGEIDAVVSAGFAADNPIEPRYLIQETEDDVNANGGSVYSYLPAKALTQTLDAVGNRPCAVVCQPCMVPLVRRIQSSGRQPIRYVFSFFCGYNMDHTATLFMLEKAGVSPGDVASIQYRGGPYPGGFQIQTRDGRTISYGKESYELLNLQFVRKGCLRCTYYMGESADLVSGDAWLRSHPRLSLLMARTDAGENAMHTALDTGDITLYSLNEQELLQMHLHNLLHKKFGDGPALKMITHLFNRVLPKRMVPFTLMSALSRVRRKMKIGIDKENLEPYNRHVR